MAVGARHRFSLRAYILAQKAAVKTLTCAHSAHFHWRIKKLVVVRPRHSLQSVAPSLKCNAQAALRICSHVFEVGGVLRCAHLVSSHAFAAFYAPKYDGRFSISDGERFVDGNSAIIQLARGSFRHCHPSAMCLRRLTTNIRSAVCDINIGEGHLLTQHVFFRGRFFGSKCNL